MRRHRDLDWWIQRARELEDRCEWLEQQWGRMRSEIETLQYQKNSFDRGREERIRTAVLERNAALAEVARLEAKLDRVKTELGHMGLLDLADGK